MKTEEHFMWKTGHQEEISQETEEEISLETEKEISLETENMKTEAGQGIGVEVAATQRKEMNFRRMEERRTSSIRMEEREVSSRRTEMCLIKTRPKEPIM